MRDRARNLVVAAVAALLLMSPLAPPAAGGPGAEDGLQDRIRAHVETLAADALEGRMTGTEGARAAADYIVGELQRIGARPLPGHGDFRFSFEFTAGVEDGGSSVTVGDRTWEAGPEVQALSLSEDGTVNGEVVFAGYGLVVPEGQGYPYDSYVGLDVEDKIVLVLRYFPEDVGQEDRQVLARYSGLRYKAMQARERGAAALLVLTGPRSPNAGTTVPMAFDTAASGSGVVAASIGDEVGEALFAATEHDLEEMQAELDTGDPHASGFDIPTRVELTARIERERRRGHNVVGVLPAVNPGSSPPSPPYVMLGAHYDHLGRGEGGNSLARGEGVGAVHNGADDNASGVAGVLAAGELLAGRQRDRGVVLAFWSGEELGLLGSTAFLEQGILPTDAIAAYVNMDMIGRLRDNRLIVQAVGSSPAWPGLLERSNVPVGLDLQIQEDPYVPTDSAAFDQESVPTLQLFTGSHEDYHRPGDDAELIDHEGIERVARFAALIVGKLADRPEAPRFVRVERTVEEGGGRDSVRAFTGTIPDYATDVEGLKLSGVIEGGPAEDAGLQGGDVIVEFAGQEIANIYDYTYALDAVKIGEPVKVVFLRDGERHEVTLTPRARR